MDIPARLAEILDRMGEACHRAGRAPESVRLVAVTKTRTPAEIRTAVGCGVRELGENRVQEAEEKRDVLADLRAPDGARPRWHLIGHLQKNKAKKAVSLFDRIHSIDSVELARRIDRAAAEVDAVKPALVQVDLAAEPTKFGLPEQELLPALESLSELDHVRVDGLMLLPPFLPDPEAVRPFFRRLRELSQEAGTRGLVGRELSMGMSHDYEVAIEEGATFIRVGTALFGPRDYAGGSDAP